MQPVKPVNVTAELQASDDGQQYRTLKKFTIDRHNVGVAVGPVPLAPWWRRSRLRRRGSSS